MGRSATAFLEPPQFATICPRSEASAGEHRVILLLRRLPGALAVVALAAFTQLPAQSAAQDALSDGEVRRLAEGLQQGSLSPAYVSGECQRHVEGSEEHVDLKQVMSTFLLVPETQAVAAFCDALVQAVKAGDLQGQTLAALPRITDDSALFLELGRVLRAVYFSHRIKLTGAGQPAQ